MSLVGTTNEEKIWNYLYDKLGNPYGVAGIMGNMYAESALNPKNLQNTYEKKLGYTDESYTAAIDNGSYTNFVKDSAGYGLVQWTYWSLKQGLYNYAKSTGKSIGDLEMQLEFLCKELNEDFNAVWNALKTSKSVLDASNIMLLQFERPADQSTSVQTKRAGYGQEYYNKYANKATTGGVNMKLVENILTKNPCYTAGRKITVKGLMLHSIGCPQPKASVFLNNWNNSSTNVCVHGFIDGNDGTIYQTLPWNHRGWHCGSGSNGSGNNTHIGVEMCEPACIKYTGGSSFTCSDIATAKAVAKRTYEAAVELFAYLCKKYNLNPLGDGVIISHKEGHSRGIASNHGDPEHLWNGLGMGYTMNTFRQAVKAKMAGGSITTPSTPTTPSSSTSSNTNFPKTPFTVRVIIDDLNIRKSPNGALVGKYTGKGSFTIVEVNDGWGLLKSYEKNRDGWIYLKNASYCTIGSTVNSGGSASTTKLPYMVRVNISDLNIRKGAGTDYSRIGYTGKGSFTIVEEKSGKGSDKGWGLLKSYEKNRDGWISLDFCEKV